jgi:5-methylcytosine-specific restriction protein A
MPWATSTRRSRLPADWTARRNATRYAAGNQCEWITADGRCPADGMECDHITPGDDHALTNLQWLCHAHHTMKTQAEAQAARPRRRRSPEPHPGQL